MKFLITTLVCLAIGLFIYFHFGFFNFNADQQPSALESKFALDAMDGSVARRAPDAKSAPQAGDADLLEGMKLYQTNCSVCHGDARTPERALGKSFYPPVPQFVKERADMPANHNFYIIKHGVRWTGMPAWGRVLDDDQIWKLTAFLARMDKLPPSVDQEWKRAAGTAAGEGGDGAMKPVPH